MIDSNAKRFNWWVSWWETKEMGSFCGEYPWWTSGARDSTTTDNAMDESIVAAIKAYNLEKVLQRVELDYKGLHMCSTPIIEYRFVICKPDDWEPFTDRFPKKGL